MIETKDTQCCNSGGDQKKTMVFNSLMESKKSTFTVSGMDCADEISAIQKALSKPKIGKVSANLMTSQVTVEHEPSLSESELISLINSAGVKVREATATTSFYTDNKKRVWLVGTSGTFLLIGLLSQWFLNAPESVLFALFLMATLFGGSLILPKAIRALKQKSLDMNVLMTMAAIGAFIIREYSEGAAVVFLFSLAEMLEAFSVARARKAIREILSITPQTATVEDGGKDKIVPVEQVEVGNTILVLAGERIPLDGT
ncbi:MAG TPA: cation transporter, partial [Pseudobdellovibrionaceae bacterium]|nr:cation transporter [Pseudobdellovibrionaceae bacterium]